VSEDPQWLRTTITKQGIAGTHMSRLNDKEHIHEHRETLADLIRLEKLRHSCQAGQTSARQMKNKLKQTTLHLLQRSAAVLEPVAVQALAFQEQLQPGPRQTVAYQQAHPGQLPQPQERHQEMAKAASEHQDESFKTEKLGQKALPIGASLTSTDL
jgi:hypothetical protein